jgi:Tfp pilus assembly protein PilF
MHVQADFYIKKLENVLLPAIVIITLAVFTPLLWSDFINFDDPALITQNPYVQQGLTVEGIRWALTTGYVANWIPLSWISHMLDVQLFGMHPAWHHFVNILLHVANTALLFLFLKRTTAATWQSAAVAMLFAVHPLHVESVAWVAERKDVLSTFFWMLTMYVYSIYVVNQGIARYISVVVVFALGLLAKPMLVTLPFVLLLLDWWPLERLAYQTKAARTTPLLLSVEKIPFFMLSVCSSFITYMVQDAAGTVSQGYTVLARIARACVSYMTYLYMMVWPVDLAVIYPFSKYPPTNAIIKLSLLALVLITITVICFRKRFPFLMVGWGWYIVTLLPVIGLIQIGQHSVADRYTYIPLVGIFVILVWGGSQLAEKLHVTGNVLTAFSAVIVMAMIVLTSRQLSYWKNSSTLFEHTVAVTKDNWVAQNNLGLVYQSEGDLDRAILHFKLSIASKPSYSLAYLNLGIVYRLRRELVLALDAFKWAVMFEPGNQEAHLCLALVYLEQGKSGLAMEEYMKLQAVESSYAPRLLKEINASGGGVLGK